MRSSNRQVVFTLKFELDEECRFTTSMLGRLAHSCEGVKEVTDDPRTDTLTVEGTADPRSMHDFLKLVVPESKIFLVSITKPSKNKKSSGVDSKNRNKIQLFMHKFTELFRKAIWRERGGGSNKVGAEKYNRRQKQKLEKANELQGGRKSRQTSKGISAVDQGSIYGHPFGTSAYGCPRQEEFSSSDDDGYVTAATEF